MTRLTEKELAKRWNMTARTLQMWRRKGIGPAFIRIGERSVFYRLEDVERYEASCVVSSKRDWKAAVHRAAGAFDLLANQARTASAKDTLTNLRDELRALLV